VQERVLDDVETETVARRAGDPLCHGRVTAGNAGLPVAPQDRGGQSHGEERDHRTESGPAASETRRPRAS